MEIRPAEVKSGAFILLAVFVFMVLVFAVGDLKTRFTSKAEYHAYLPDAKFLKVHDVVTFAGMRVGEINRVDVPSDRFGYVKVYIRVDPEIEVREDSTLLLKQDGMLGAKYLEISPGTPAAKRTPAGAEIKAYVVPAITDIAEAIQKPLEKIDQLLSNLNAIVGSADNQKNIADILAEFKVLVVNLGAEVKRIADGIVATTDKAQATLGEAELLIHENRPAIQSLFRNLDEIMAKLSKAADSLDQLLHDADGLILQNNVNIYETIRGLRDTIYHLEMAAKRIRANPGVLLFGSEETPEERVRKDETYLRMKGRTRRFDKEDPK